MIEAEQFRAESRAIHALLADLPARSFGDVTQFKGWTIDDVLGHLHFWNGMAALQIEDEAGLQARLGEMLKAIGAGTPMREAENRYLGPLSGPALLSAYVERCEHVASLFAAADPRVRLKWAGPEMSARSSISARYMETWAHAQAAYDLLGVERVEDDAIASIVMLGVNTFGWSFKVNHQDPPGPMPCLRLTAPSGAIWEHGENGQGNEIEGSAVEFCQVVTQTRNVADTSLSVKGETAAAWMALAQCFAGGASPPPSPGTRFRLTPQS